MARPAALTSLLFLAFTTRFLNLAALIRALHRDWQQGRDESLRAQIDNLRLRLELIRWMQLFGALSLVVCITAMLAILAGAAALAALLHLRPQWAADFMAAHFGSPMP